MASINRHASDRRAADRRTTALDHALTAASRGLPVIPLTRAKLPAVRSPHRSDPRPTPCQGECGRIGHGVHDATADPAAIRRLFAAAPWATGYGIACGRPPHHLVGLDLDVKDGTDSTTALADLARDHGFTIPPTATVLTPSGGRHLWLSGPSGLTIPNSAGRLAPGIDVRGAGGYLVGPGSHTTAGTYRLAPGPSVPAPAPPPLIDLLLPPPPSAPPPVPARTPSTALADFVAASRPGERNARLFWAACRAYETGHGPELTPALTRAALSTGLTERETQATITSAARHTSPTPQGPEP